MKKTIHLATGLGLFLFAVAVRALPWRRVFADGQVHPMGNDAYYHLRRIVYSVVHFPQVLDWDRYIHFPEGARPIWTPVFDWGVALLARPFFRPGELESVERIAVWVPPVLGGLTVVALYRLALRHFDAATAALAGLFLCVFSGHFWYSQLGFVDHHVAVALVSTLLLGSAMKLLGQEARGEEPPAWRSALTTGGMAGTALLVWPGSLLHVGMVEIAWLLVLPAAGGGAAVARGRAWRFAAAQAVAGLLVAPLALPGEWPQWGSWSPVVLSRFQVWLFALGLVFGAGCALLWGRTGLGATVWRRRLGAAGLAACLLAASFLAIPELRAGAGEAWSWLAREESFQSGVMESQPLLAMEGQLSWKVALERLSGFAPLFPLLAVAALAWAWRRGPARAPLLLWLGWSVGLCIATLMQRRFFNSFSVALALLAAWSVCAAWRASARYRIGPRPLRVAALAAGVAVTLGLLWPLAETYRLHLENLLVTGDAPRRIRPWLVKQRSQVEMARWLSRRTPPTRGWMDASQVPEYAILAPWELGHVIEYVARRPTIVDNFGDDLGPGNFELAQKIYQSPEPEAARGLEALGVRYVVAQALEDFLGAPPVEGSVFLSLYFHDGSEFVPEMDQAGLRWLPALQRLRMVYESRVWFEGGVDAPSFYKVYELVPGARIVGRASPHAAIRLALRLHTNRGREFVYQTHTVADAGGRYRLRVPYATQGGPPSVRSQGPYRLYCRSQSGLLQVTEAQIRRGAELEGPPLCLPDGPA